MVITVYPKKYAHDFVVVCFVVVMQSFIMSSHEVFIHIHQGCFAGIGAIVRLPQCQWSKPDGYGKISQCITTTKHSKANTVCIFLGIYCRSWWTVVGWWKTIWLLLECTVLFFKGDSYYHGIIMTYNYHTFRSQAIWYWNGMQLDMKHICYSIIHRHDTFQTWNISVVLLQCNCSGSGYY